MEAKHRSPRLLLTMCLLADAQKDDPDTFCSSRMVRRGAAARGRSFMAGEDTQKSDQKPNIPFVYAADAQPLATDFRAQREELDEMSAVRFLFLRLLIFVSLLITPIPQATGGAFKKSFNKMCSIAICNAALIRAAHRIDKAIAAYKRAFSETSTTGVDVQGCNEADPLPGMHAMCFTFNCLCG